LVGDGDSFGGAVDLDGYAFGGEVGGAVEGVDFFEGDEVSGSFENPAGVGVGGVAEAEGEDWLGLSVEGGACEVVGMVLIRGEGIGAEGLLDTEAVSVLVVVDVEDEGEVRGALVFGGSAVVDLRDVGVIHHGERLAFGLEAGHDLPGVHAQLDDFQSNATLDRLELLRHVNVAEAAFADFLEELVVVNGRALAFGVGGGFGDFGSLIDDAFFIVVSGVKCLDAFPELGVIATGFVEIADDFFRGSMLGSLEENFEIRVHFLYVRNGMGEHVKKVTVFERRPEN
jgi:hypothetical protein